MDGFTKNTRDSHMISYQTEYDFVIGKDRQAQIIELT